VQGDFDYQLHALQMNMMGEIMAILIPFLTFTSTYIAPKARNILTLMLEPCFMTRSQAP
jgi:hypothetical protein